MKRIFAFLLVLSMILSGCSWMEGSYVSVTPHQVGYGQTGDDVPTVSSYSDLRNALTNLIDSGEESGLFTLVDYSVDEAREDMENVVRYATETYPIGAYAVSTIEYDFGTGPGASALSVDITYLHPKSEISKIRTIRDSAGMKSAIAGALASCQESLVLLITDYQDTDFIQLIAQYAALHPDDVIEVPQVTAQVYPDRGNVRLLALQFGYQTSREELRSMQKKVEQVFSSAALYVSSEADTRTKYTQLYTFLMERYDYTFQTSITPSYSLLCDGIGDSRAFAQVYAAMCRQIGLEALTVSGTHNSDSRCWNIIQVDGVYYHLDLLACAQAGGFRLVTDNGMNGYGWDREIYPACGTEVPPTDPTSPTDETTE